MPAEPPGELDVHAELAEARVGPLHRTLGALVALMTLFDGYDTFNPAYVIHYVAGPWGLSPGQAGFLVSSGLIGFLLGAAGHGVAADRFGRRGETFAASFGFGALMQVMSFIGGLALAMLADRRPAASTRLLAAWWGLGGVSVLALVFYGGHGVNLVCAGAAGFLIIGAQHVLNNFTAGTYDTTMRASGVGMELGVGRVGAILGPFVAGLLQGATGGPDAMFWAIGGAALFAAACIASLGIGRGEAMSAIASAQPRLQSVP